MRKSLFSQLLLATALATAGCATDADLDVVATRQAATITDRARETLLCDPNICLLHDLTDTDGDGVADIDEIAVGTDPKDPWSRPHAADLAGRVATGRLPSFELGDSIVISLPTIGPDGQEIFGGRDLLPARKSALDTAGITNLGSNGLDLALGLTIAHRDSKGGGPSFSFRAPRWAQLGQANAGDPYLAITGALSTSKSPMESVEFGDRTRSGDLVFGIATATNQAGGTWDVQYQSSPSYTWVHASGEFGGPNPWMSKDVISTTFVDADGVSTTTTRTESISHQETGEHTDTTTKTTTTTSADGHDSFVESSSQTTSFDRNGKPTSVEPPRSSTSACHDGTCESTTKANEGSENQADGETDEDSTTAFMNPDYAEMKSSPEALHATFAARGGTIHVVDPNGDRAIGYSYDPKGPSDKYGKIALYSDANAKQPLVLHIPRTAQPEYDPNLPTTDVEMGDGRGYGPYSE